MKEEIYTSDPIDKQAAMVAGNSKSNKKLKKKELRASLSQRSKDVQAQILRMPKSDRRRKALGKTLHEINSKINALGLSKDYNGISYYILDVIKQELPAVQFEKIIDKAYAAMRSDRATRIHNTEDE